MSQQMREAPIGFYDPKGKMFYSVPNQQVYQELMAMFRHTTTPKEMPATQSSIHYE